MSRIATSGTDEELTARSSYSLHLTPVNHVNPCRSHEHDADDDVLQRRVDAEQNHARLQRLHEHGAEHSARHRADAARKRGPANNGGGDDQEFGERAFRVRSRIETGDRYGAADGGKKPHEHEYLHDHPARVDAGEFGRLWIAADGVDIAPETRSPR